MKEYGYRAAITYINTYNLTRDIDQAWTAMKALLNRVGIQYEEVSTYQLDLIDDEYNEQTLIFNNTVRAAGIQLPGDEYKE